MKLYQELNGVEAAQALQQQQRQINAPGVVPEQPQPLRPWLLPPRKNFDKPCTFAMTATPNQPSGSGVKPEQVQKQKEFKLFRAGLLNHAAGISFPASPSTGTSISLQPMQSCIKKNPKQQHPNLIIKLQAKRVNADDFHVQSLNTFISLKDSENQWKVIKIEPNITHIMQKIRKIYFRHVSKVPAYTVMWNLESFTDLTNFTINPECRTIYLNPKTLLNCSRVHFFSALLHALIHCCVYETSFSRLRNIYEHDSNFMEIMRFFNEKLGLEIGTDHTFLRAVNQNLLTYQCQGRCSESLPFYGVVKSCSDQDFPPQVLTESNHRENCNGKFHRVFEATHTTVNNNIETKYVVHSSIENPRGPETESELGSSNANNNPRELVDITNDDESGPKIVKMTQVIDLDDDEFSDTRKKPRKIVETIKMIQPVVFETCPLCSSSLSVCGGFRSHIDLCLGIRLW